MTFFDFLQALLSGEKMWDLEWWER